MSFLQSKKFVVILQVVQYILPGFKSIGIQVSSDIIHKCIGIICINSISFDLQVLPKSFNKAWHFCLTITNFVSTTNCLAFKNDFVCKIPEATKGRRKGRVLLPLASLASHSCDNNAAYSINPDTLRQKIYTEK